MSDTRSQPVQTDPRDWMSHSTRQAHPAEDTAYPAVRFHAVNHDCTSPEGSLKKEPAHAAPNRTKVSAARRHPTVFHGPLRNRMAMSAPSPRPSMWHGNRTNGRNGSPGTHR